LQPVASRFSHHQATRSVVLFCLAERFLDRCLCAPDSVFLQLRLFGNRITTPRHSLRQTPFRAAQILVDRSVSAHHLPRVRAVDALARKASSARAASCGRAAGYVRETMAGELTIDLRGTMMLNISCLVMGFVKKPVTCELPVAMAFSRGCGTITLRDACWGAAMRAARERKRQLHPVDHLEQSRPRSRHRSPRREPAVDRNRRRADRAQQGGDSEAGREREARSSFAEVTNNRTIA
jgi:hypothetical protein